MKEKKEMQIVVTADDSKAKTSLQKLADYLKKNFESPTEVKVDAKQQELVKNYTTLNSKMKEAQNKWTNALYEIDDESALDKLYKEFKDLELQTNKASQELNKYSNSLKQVSKQVETNNWADKLKETMSETNVETDKTSKSIDNLGTKVANSLETASKKTRKFVLSLFSVRTAWAVISRASSSYLSQNESTTNKVAAAWSYLGNILGPVIEKIVSWLQYGIAYVNVFVKALTGVDFLAKSIQKTAAKTNKELKKTVSSMDEIVNLDIDNGANSGVGAANALQDIADLELNPKIVEFMEKLGGAIKEVWDWAKKAWNFLEEHFGTTGAGLIVGGLALLIGGAGRGLIGVSTLLKTISTIGTIAIGVDLLYGALTGRDLIQDLKDIKQGFDDLKVMSEDLEKATKNNRETWETAIDKFDLAGSSVDDLNGLIDILSSDSDRASQTAERLTKQMEEQGSWYMNNSGSIEENSKELQYNKDKLSEVKDKLLANRQTLKKGTEEYNANELAIEKVNKALEKVDGQVAQARINVGLSLDYSGLWYNITKFFSNIFDYWDDSKGIKPGAGKYSSGKVCYATGGFPEEGQMFIANERGPELVGNIGGSTAVANNQQIVESVSQGVASAIAGVLTNQKSTSQSAQYLYINGSEFAKAVYDDMETERHRRNTNTSIRRA